MAYNAQKTEHAGAKHGSGAYWGPKQDAKKESNKVRRRVGLKEAKQALTEAQKEVRGRNAREIKSLYELM